MPTNTLNFYSYLIPSPSDIIKLWDNYAVITIAVAAAVIPTIVIFAMHLYKKCSLAMSNKNGIPLPPGPPAHWFWSNALPTVHAARAFADHVRQYGPVVSFRQGSQVTIVIGSIEAINEIMEKEGVSLVDRPLCMAAGEILSRGMRIVLARSGDRFRRLRKVVHTHFQPKASAAYKSMQLEHARDFIFDIMDDPKNHQKHATRFAASIILRVTYGKSTPTTYSDPEVIRIHKTLKNLDSVVRPGAFLVDTIPLLRYFPGYTKQLDEWHHEELALFRLQLGRVKTELEKNTAAPSLAKTLLETPKEHLLSVDEMAYLAGSLFAAGVDTTANGITSLIMAAACYPLAQAKVQEELDTVVGSDRAPTFEDSDSLPQLHAFLLEVLRLRPPIPRGVPHRATKDIIWRGYCIPEGATVYGCHEAICRDPIAFPEPEKFHPSRWLDSKGRLVDKMKSFTYGFGRRACPASHFANQSLYINLALLLWSFRIVERPDGPPIDMHASSRGFIAYPPPFEVDFIPRRKVERMKDMMI